ncbi:DNA topoisomerase IB [Sphingosinicella sp. BN140058]|uniref:DNA topoisomerase IB n=1 Tax=Sphingosinicella sp. BN140058 TaxID=1892855 RepID=UPI0010128F55|nr:DNA topoisomerase IB [Sphingosinicella sp. BN140058]QAY76530.1 DNA topoisomerase IB [Sphingosinicella sp. BN140058]
MIRYVDDSAPGITRKRQGRYWQYFAADGSRITDREEIDRLNGVGMPPAYEKCWFCPDPVGHIQAVGWDARGRKQYRYHPLFREQQETKKYERLARFGEALPKLRQRLEEDLTGKPTAKETVLAAVVRLIDETRMRVGNEEYAKENKSFGATTLRNRHAKVERGKLKISYTGKHGIKRTVTITDRNLLRIAKKTQDLPGQNLFEYVTGEGDVCAVTSSDVNAYIKEAMGEDFTAKDFRTWGASTIAFEEMIRRVDEKGSVKLKSVMEPVAEALGNTPAISRKSYVHPALIEAAKDAGAIGERKLPRSSKYLSAAERGLIEFLDALPEEAAKVEAKVAKRARSKGKSKAAAEAEIAAETSKKVKAEAA